MFAFTGRNPGTGPLGQKLYHKKTVLAEIRGCFCQGSNGGAELLTDKYIYGI